MTKGMSHGPHSPTVCPPVISLQLPRYQRKILYIKHKTISPLPWSDLSRGCSFRPLLLVRSVIASLTSTAAMSTCLSLSHLQSSWCSASRLAYVSFRLLSLRLKWRLVLPPFAWPLIQSWHNVTVREVKQLIWPVYKLLIGISMVGSIDS